MPLGERSTSTKSLLCAPHAFILDDISDDLKNLACINQMVQYNWDVDTMSTDDVSASVWWIVMDKIISCCGSGQQHRLPWANTVRCILFQQLVRTNVLLSSSKALAKAVERKLLGEVQSWNERGSLMFWKKKHPCIQVSHFALRSGPQVPLHHLAMMAPYCQSCNSNGVLLPGPLTATKKTPLAIVVQVDALVTEALTPNLSWSCIAGEVFKDTSNLLQHNK